MLGYHIESDRKLKVNVSGTRSNIETSTLVVSYGTGGREELGCTHSPCAYETESARVAGGELTVRYVTIGLPGGDSIRRLRGLISSLNRERRDRRGNGG